MAPDSSAHQPAQNRDDRDRMGAGALCSPSTSQLLQDRLVGCQTYIRGLLATELTRGHASAAEMCPLPPAFPGGTELHFLKEPKC